MRIFQNENELKEHYKITHSKTNFTKRDYRTNKNNYKPSTNKSIPFKINTNKPDLLNYIRCSSCPFKKFNSQKEFEKHMLKHEKYPNSVNDSDRWAFHCPVKNIPPKEVRDVINNNKRKICETCYSNMINNENVIHNKTNYCSESKNRIYYIIYRNMSIL